ncbi:protein sip-5 [Pseudoxanthomonas wuyuanensis]|uniref:Protein sip-5 n=1 Tax=Pseudoxanthomonas wuyuanensis TaxID=1073196 RepID=A0A286D2C4_9GAMM|nr:protein sip-5 [Pseudoxanthomonas wuyuanensis]KAF1723134.1 protein sip-5 [Pseudoxanthomonas wuyuanensis]SOD52808.1 hypothetical protein SAMN06296416_10292 [Pseudoxanthomonas wuyuanensis]
MNFEALQRRVERAERLVEGRAEEARGQWQILKSAWRQGWTPLRIVVAGGVTGFLVGRSEPLRAMTGARWLQMVGSISGMIASLQAAAAAEQAEEAAESAEATAPDAQAQGDDSGYAEEPLVDERFDEDPVTAVQPRPAEAATELSER